MGVQYRVGVDENGVGPRLGPMVITAVGGRSTTDGNRYVSQKPRGKRKERIGDSKDLVTHGNVALGEAWARVLCERMGERPTSPEELVYTLSHDPKHELHAPCPSEAFEQCWKFHGAGFEADASMMKDIHREATHLEKKGVALDYVRSVIVCTRRLNDAKERGIGRFHVDLHAMERLILAARDRAGVDLAAICGKVGGLGRYENAFGPLSGRLFVTLKETRAESSYRFPNLGDLSFKQDADASDQLVGIASIVGKYLREILMGSIVSHYQGLVVDLATASGYHDPITARFVEATALVRKRRRVPTTCFERAPASSFA